MSEFVSGPDVRVESSLSGQLPEIATGCSRSPMAAFGYAEMRLSLFERSHGP